MKKNLFFDFLYWLFIYGPERSETIPFVLGYVVPGLCCFFGLAPIFIPTTIEKATPLCFLAIPISWAIAFALYCIKTYGEKYEKK